MKSLARKELRKIDRALDQVFGANGFYTPKWPDDFKIERNPLAREVKLTNGKAIFFSDLGLDGLRVIVGTLHDTNAFEGLAAYSDIWSACRGTIKDLLSKSLRPDDAAEFVHLARQSLEPNICDRTFVVQLIGLELKDVDGLALGSLRVVPPSADYITRLDVKHSGDVIPKFIEYTKSTLWLIGTTRGTDRIANQRFREKAHLATGLLAVMAASLYQHGAHGFRIGIVMSPEEAYGRAQYLSWRETEKELAVTYQFTRAQRFTIDAEMRANVEQSAIGKRLFSILESTIRSDLEETVIKAIYWYSDAHRDEVTVMRLLKYWSCIEAFFSGDGKEITRSVSVGLAATLTHGHLGFLPHDEYGPLKKRVAQFYGHRSMATHAAAYAHVSDKDVSDLSQWVSWLIVSAIVFVEHGATRTSQIAEWTRRIDSFHSRPSKWLRTLEGKARFVIQVARDRLVALRQRIRKRP